MEQNSNPTVPPVDAVRLIADNALCRACGCTGIGGRKENQDNYGGTTKDGMVILTVCDGMGGMAGGQTASFIAVSEIIGTLSAYTEKEMGVDALRTALANANSAVYRQAMAEPSLRGMGTTATVAVLTKVAAYVAHVGDSRIYQLRKGKKIFRTFDHSKVFEMVSQGMITEEQARQSSFSNIITRALGIRPTVEVEVQMLPYRKDDRFVLCCDGIWNTEPEQQMLRLFSASASPNVTLEQLTNHVNKTGVERGGDHDNLTAIIADMNHPSLYQYSVFHQLRNRLRLIGGKKKP